jgi:hypothetical protein
MNRLNRIGRRTLLCMGLLALAAVALSIKQGVG